MIRLSFLLGTFLLASFTLIAQNFQSTFQPAEIPQASRAYVHAATGLLRYAEFPEANAIASEKANEWIQTYLQPTTGESWSVLRSETDQIGWTHTRYNHLLSGIIIENDQYILHHKNGFIRSANGLFKSISSIPSATPTLSNNEAITAAVSLVPSDTVLLNVVDMETPTLRWLWVDNELVLTYKVDVFSMMPLFREYVYVNAQTGDIVQRNERLHDTDVPTSVPTRYSGTQTIVVDSVNATLYRLRETTRGDGVTTLNLQNGQNYNNAVEFTDDDNLWDGTANDDDAALDAHFGAEATYDYFMNEHGRDSYDNQGAELVSYVHFGNNYINAFWNGQYMTYGDGNAGAGYTPLTTLTIAGHEMAHGVTEFTAGLIYNAESGALNESFSDIFGVVIDFLHNPNPNYQIGDQINTSGIGFRDMADPNVFSDPDTYLGDFWHTSPADNYGVHTNSGVQNFWFYLLVNGGSGVNDIQNNYQVSGIGLTDAGKIAYRNLSVYLTPNSDYNEAQFYGVQSAADLFGPCAPQTDATVAAWYAVGLGNTQALTPVSNFEAIDTYACSVPANIYFNNLSTNADSYLWNFGDGNTSTSINPVHTYSAAGTYTVQLIAVNSTGCSGDDTLTMLNYIEVEDNNGPVSAVCVPQTINGSPSDGIYEFDFGSINNTSLGSHLGYQNFSCVASTELIEGTLVPMKIRTGASTDSRVLVWIDLNDDGGFSNSELIFDGSENNSNQQIVEIIVPNGIVFDKELRLRVLADHASNNTILSCQQPQNGQAEDYSVIIKANSLPPIANFGANETRVPTGTTIQFIDSSLNAPTAWNWTFEGGNINSSINQNPSVTYNTPGVYTASLTVSNSDGTDSLTRTNYIIVDTEANICTDNSSDADYGTLYDSGGKFGDYGSNENCGFVIEPACAVGLDVNITGNLGTGDFFIVYHGTDANGDILFVQPSSGAINESFQLLKLPVFVEFKTNASSNASGFAMTWDALPATGKEVAEISSSRGFIINADETSTFTGPSTDYPVNATWDFGDGFTSNDPAVTHSYESPGVYTIALTMSNCFGDTTFTREIVVERDQSVTEPYMIVYPSPSNGQFTVEENYAENIESITVSTAIGQVLIQYTPSYLSNVHTFDLRRHAQGVYYVSVVYSDGQRAHGEVVITE